MQTASEIIQTAANFEHLKISFIFSSNLVYLKGYFSLQEDFTAQNQGHTDRLIRTPSGAS